MILVFLLNELLVFGMVLLMGWLFDKYGLAVRSECIITSDVLSNRNTATETTIYLFNQAHDALIIVSYLMTVSNSTCAPNAQSSGLVYSSGL